MKCNKDDYYFIYIERERERSTYIDDCIIILYI